MAEKIGVKTGLFVTTAVSLILIPAASILASDKKSQPPTPPQIYVMRDDPHQSNHLLLKNPPEECLGSLFTTRVCWKIYPVTSQAFTKKWKTMGLLVSTSLNATSDLWFTSASLTFAIDGEIFKTDNLSWTRDGQFNSTWVELQDEQLVRRIGRANAVWVTAEVPGPFSVQLSPQIMDSFRAVVSQYDALEPTTGGASAKAEASGELETVESQLASLDTKAATLNQNIDNLSARCTTWNESKTCKQDWTDLLLYMQSLSVEEARLLSRELALLNSAQSSPVVQAKITAASILLNEAKGHMKVISDLLSEQGEHADAPSTHPNK